VPQGDQVRPLESVGPQGGVGCGLEFFFIGYKHSLGYFAGAFTGSAVTSVTGFTTPPPNSYRGNFFRAFAISATLGGPYFRPSVAGVCPVIAS
jgi:hypothetical protein